MVEEVRRDEVMGPYTMWCFAATIAITIYEREAMGQQQAMLVVVGVLIISVAIATGYSLFASSQVQSEKLAIINDISTLAATAWAYHSKPVGLGGGQGGYGGFNPPSRLIRTENASITLQVTSNSLEIRAESVLKPGNSISATLDEHGVLGGWGYAGDFR